MFQQMLFHHSYLEFSASALLFPPVTSRARFLIHKTVQEEFPELHSFSIGEDSERRTAVSWSLLDPDKKSCNGKDNINKDKDSSSATGVASEHHNSKKVGDQLVNVDKSAVSESKQCEVDNAISPQIKKKLKSAQNKFKSSKELCSVESRDSIETECSLEYLDKKSIDFLTEERVNKHYVKNKSNFIQTEKSKDKIEKPSVIMTADITVNNARHKGRACTQIYRPPAARMGLSCQMEYSLHSGSINKPSPDISTVSSLHYTEPFMEVSMHTVHNKENSSSRVPKMRRPDKEIYIPKGRRYILDSSKDSSFGDSDTLRAPSPTPSVCSVTSEYSGRNRYSSKKQSGNRNFVCNNENERFPGKPPVAMRRDDIKKSSSLFSRRTVQLIERCLNQDSPSAEEQDELKSSNCDNYDGNNLPMRDSQLIYLKESCNELDNNLTPKKSKKTRRRRPRSRSQSLVQLIPGKSTSYENIDRIFSHSSSIDNLNVSNIKLGVYSCESKNNSCASSRHSSLECIVQSSLYNCCYLADELARIPQQIYPAVEVEPSYNLDSSSENFILDNNALSSAEISYGCNSNSSSELNSGFNHNDLDASFEVPECSFNSSMCDSLSFNNVEDSNRDTKLLKPKCIYENLPTSWADEVEEAERNSKDPVNLVGTKVINSLNASSQGCEDSWEALYDDSGECLDPALKKQLFESLGKVKLKKPGNQYSDFDSLEPEINQDAYSHVIEIYDFPASFKTQDLITIFNFPNVSTEIKWVDDTHALGVFSTSIIAAEALKVDHPLIKTRPISLATKASKEKALRITDAILPFKPRPQTSAALARKLVSGALGIKVAVPKEIRDAEVQKLKDARDRKKLVAKQRRDAWEGTFT